jgi:hypothetical protein
MTEKSLGEEYNPDSPPFSQTCDYWAKVIAVDQGKDLTLLKILDENGPQPPAVMSGDIDSVLHRPYTMLGLSGPDSNRFFARSGIITEIFRVHILLSLNFN